MRKEIPILMSTPMVIATIEDRKKMTRRLKGLENINNCPDNWAHDGGGWKNPEGQSAILFGTKNGEHEEIIKLPWNVGDILYVRESWQHTRNLGINEEDENSGYIYKASQNGKDWESSDENWTWKPSIHLPKAASRIWLEVTDVRVERLKDITQEDAISEGIGREWDGSKFWYEDYSNPKAMLRQQPLESFKTLWQKINGEKNWNSNPWVWCVSFSVLSTTGRTESLNEIGGK